MTDKELEKLIDDMAEDYANDNKAYISDDCDDTDYFSLRTAFIDGFKAGMKFKNKEKQDVIKYEYKNL